MASLFKHKRTTLERAEKFISSSEWTDCNLYSQLYPSIWSVKAIYHFAHTFPDPPKANYKRLTWQEATSNVFNETSVGKSFGPTWATHWFRVEYNIPAEHLEKEVHLIWDSSSEALVWNSSGDALQGLSGEYMHSDYYISKKVEKIELEGTLYVEMACNGIFGAGRNSLIGPPEEQKTFALKKVHLAVFDKQVSQLLEDLKCLSEIAKHLPESNPRSYQALYTANQMVNTIKLGDRSSYQIASKIAAAFFSERNGESQHAIIAVGNCHIDSAWLWPYAETMRKCARSWSSAVRLMEEYDSYKFVCSQAQQLSWVKENYPSVWDKIKLFHSRGQFIPVGGTWVEMDGNIPSGESFIRQFLYGQEFFKNNFGKICSEFWLPDTFGYSAQLPQIMRHCGVKHFLTQKLSWSLVNSFPHHNFWWKGIDGTSVLTHFPPGDSYSMEMTVAELLKTVQNLKDKGRVSQSIFLYGHGDGGGGPTASMIERALRFRDVDGVPKVELSTPDDFFSRLEKESSNLCIWTGELYLELHNATYTTHADVKKLNRKGEVSFHDTELLMSLLLAHTRTPTDYPELIIKKLWHKFLLNQFHDVLPGTSIGIVYEDALNYYDDVMTAIAQLKEKTLSKLFDPSNSSSEILVFNSLSWTRTECLLLDDESVDVVTVSSIGISRVIGCQFSSISVVNENGNFLVENFHLKAKLDKGGKIISMVLKNGQKESIIPGSYGNQLVLFDDVPLYWDAWDVMDYHLETRTKEDTIVTPLHILKNLPEMVILQAILNVGSRSRIVLKVTLDACKPYLLFQLEVDWKEAHKFLKVEFPINVVAKEATYEIQFGHLTRPTHQNTSWDAAQFEVCGHKWADISEHDFGVAILNDCKYGYSARGSVLTLSLLRSSKSPDEDADMGDHIIQYAVMPHQKSFQEAGVIQRAYELNYPLLKFYGKINQSEINSWNSFSYFELSHPSVVVASVKKAEGKTALVVRLYEAYGGRTSVTLITKLDIESYQLCDGLENPISDIFPWESQGIVLSFEPFKIMSILLHLL